MRRKILRIFAAMLIISCLLVVSAYAESATVTGSKVYIRSGPGLNYRVVDCLDKGTVVELTNRSNSSWYAVSYNGREGFMSSRYLDINSEYEDADIIVAEGTGYIDGMYVRFRSGPSTSSSILGEYSRGKELTITGTSGDWTACIINGQSGYIYSDYISTSPVFDSSDSQSGYEDMDYDSGAYYPPIENGDSSDNMGDIIKPEGSQPEFKPQPENKPAPEPEITPEPDSEPDFKPLPNPGTKPEVRPQPSPEIKPGNPEIKPLPSPEPSSEPGTEPEIKPLPNPGTKPEVKPEPSPEIKPGNPEIKPLPSPDPKPQPSPEPTLKPQPSPAPSEKPEPQPSPLPSVTPTVHKAGVITGDYVRFRTGPSTSHSIIDNLNKGQEITITGTAGDWTACTVNGKDGFVFSKYVAEKEIKPENPVKPQNPAEQKPGYITANAVRFRSGPSTSASILDELNYGNKVTITGTTGDWTAVIYNGQSGFVYSQYVKAGEYTKPNPSGGTELGRQIADYALQYVGYNYVWGGMSPETGFDCSGFTSYVYKHFGYSLNRVACDQARNGVHVEHADMQPGDIICFYSGGDYIGHVGIYIGNNMFVHAANSRTGVVTTELSGYYESRGYEVRRII